MLPPFIIESCCKPEVNPQLNPTFTMPELLAVPPLPPLQSRLLRLLHLDAHSRRVIGRVGIGRIREGGRTFGDKPVPDAAVTLTDRRAVHVVVRRHAAVFVAKVRGQCGCAALLKRFSKHSGNAGRKQ
jgi:hypothetical protein